LLEAITLEVADLKLMQAQDQLQAHVLPLAEITLQAVTYSVDPVLQDLQLQVIADLQEAVEVQAFLMEGHLLAHQEVVEYLVEDLLLTHQEAVVFLQVEAAGIALRLGRLEPLAVLLLEAEAQAVVLAHLEAAAIIHQEAEEVIN